MNLENLSETKQKLITFERRIADYYEAGKIKAPIHLAYGNEEQIIDLFKQVKPEDWVFTTYRSHYHALLKGIPEAWLEKEILEGRSMGIMSNDYRFCSSAIVSGQLPIALGMALSMKIKGADNRVWAFCGDMAAETGEFNLCTKYAARKNLPITFVVEDNGWSVDTPTKQVWGIDGTNPTPNIIRYEYNRNKDGKGFPHHGSGKWVPF